MITNLGLRLRLDEISDPVFLSHETYKAFFGLLSRDWSVQVLDAWRMGNSLRQQVERSADLAGKRCEVELYFERPDSREYHYGPTPDAARLAAAEAVFSSLPADVRAKLGERP